MRLKDLLDPIGDIGKVEETIVIHPDHFLDKVLFVESNEVLICDTVHMSPQIDLPITFPP